jgi:hypothetical protein
MDRDAANHGQPGQNPTPSAPRQTWHDGLYIARLVGRMTSWAAFRSTASWLSCPT